MKNKMSRNRGRPRDKIGVADFTALEYIDQISIKRDLDLESLFDSFFEALEGQKSKCGNLLIECREKTIDYAIFLVTEGSNVVAQFSFPIHVLQDEDFMRSFISTKKLRPKKIGRIKVQNPSIRELKMGMKGINLVGRVIEISKSNTVFGRLGEPKKVANAVLKDETGVIQLPLWDQQIDTVGLGDLVQIDKAYVGYFRGKLQLRVRKSNQIKVIKKDELTE
jgi:replication factor A1